MARGSKAGACSSNTQGAKANCLKHDRRNEQTEKVPSYVNKNLSHLNRTVYEDPMIEGRKSIVPLVRQAEQLYTEKTHQKCQKSFQPFRESVLVIRPDTTDEQLMTFKGLAEKTTGWKCIGIYVHQDEGFVKSKYIEGEDGFKVNYHAHVLWSCQDLTTGKAIRCDRRKLSQMQDDLAMATGMERGNRASETGIRHRNTIQQRITSQEARLDDLTNQVANANQTLEDLEQDARDEQEQFNELHEGYQSDLDDLSKKIDKAEAHLTELQQQSQEAQAEANKALFTKTQLEGEVKALKEQKEDLDNDIISSYLDYTLPNLPDYPIHGSVEECSTGELCIFGKIGESYIPNAAALLTNEEIDFYNQGLSPDNLLAKLCMEQLVSYVKTDLKKKVDDAKNEESEAKKRLETLKTSIAKAERIDADITKKTEKIADLDYYISTKNKNINDLDGEISNKKKTISDLDNSISTKTEKVEDLDYDISTKNNKLNGLNADISSKTSEQNTLKSEIDELKKTMERQSVDWRAEYFYLKNKYVNYYARQAIETAAIKKQKTFTDVQATMIEDCIAFSTDRNKMVRALWAKAVNHGKVKGYSYDNFVPLLKEVDDLAEIGLDKYLEERGMKESQGRGVSY